MTHIGLIGWTPVSPGAAVSVDLADGYAFVADMGGVLDVFDISDPTAPTVVGSYSQPGQELIGVDVVGDYAYLAWDYYGLVRVDISDPTNPTYAGTQKDGTYANSFDSDDGVYGYVSYGYTYGSELKVYDLASFPSAPVASYNAVGNRHAGSVDVVGDRLYMAATNGGPYFEIVDVSNPLAPVQVAYLPTPQASYGTWSGEIEVAGDYAYWARGALPSQGLTGGLLTIGIGDENNPYVADFDSIPDAGIVALPGGGGSSGLDVVGDRLYMASTSGLYIYDLSDPADPALLINPNVDTDFALPGAFLPSRGGDVEVDNGFAYVTAFEMGNAGGLAVYDVADDIACDLFKGQGFEADIGDVVFSNTVDGLRITLTGQDDWTITEAKLHLGDVDTATRDVSGFPVNRGGNPKVGQFDYRADAVGDEIVFDFTLAELDAADTDDDGIIAVATHAELEGVWQNCQGGLSIVEAGAWGGCEGMDLDFGGKSTAMVMEIDLADLGLFV
ncbi:LVIVD repeat-containing protein [Tropicimonas marinistellae]|uniref:LVIVD repeat-containing protein n=1 Tax=Tropicimonas marinistellae TaxID=1739787 RepID=UPI001372E8D3|nr:hypothetical protein [Tropicimonas marinistellae]